MMLTFTKRNQQSTNRMNGLQKRRCTLSTHTLSHSLCVLPLILNSQHTALNSQDITQYTQISALYPPFYKPRERGSRLLVGYIIVILCYL